METYKTTVVLHLYFGIEAEHRTCFAHTIVCKHVIIKMRSIPNFEFTPGTFQLYIESISSNRKLINLQQKQQK